MVIESLDNHGAMAAAVCFNGDEEMDFKATVICNGYKALIQYNDRKNKLQ